MSFVLGFLGVILGIFVSLFLIVFIVLKKIQKATGISGVNPVTALKNFSKETEISNTQKCKCDDYFSRTSNIKRFS